MPGGTSVLRSIRVAALLCGALLLGLPTPARGEAFLDAFMGKSFTQDTDLRIKQSRLGNDYTFESMSFRDDSFTDPPYYGVRAGYFFERHPWLGLAVEFFHMKITAETSDVRPVEGTRNGVALSGGAGVNSLVQRFAVTHGVNYLTLDALLRYAFLQSPERFPKGRLQLYTGVGLGPVIGHPETRVENVRSEPGYELAGLGVQGFVGARFLILKNLGVFTEYKFSHSALEVAVPSGQGRVQENTHHLVGGITIHFGSF